MNKKSLTASKGGGPKPAMETNYAFLQDNCSSLRLKSLRPKGLQPATQEHEALNNINDNDVM